MELSKAISEGSEALKAGIAELGTDPRFAGNPIVRLIHADQSLTSIITAGAKAVFAELGFPSIDNDKYYELKYVMSPMGTIDDDEISFSQLHVIGGTAGTVPTFIPGVSFTPQAYYLG